MKVPPPERRRLRIFAIDPLVSPLSDPVVTIEVPWEDLKPGPQGQYLHIVDYDATAKKYYSPVDLGDPHVLARDGLDPSESDPRFHQQTVYAVVSATLERFRHALGRYVKPHGASRVKGRVPPLMIYPHGVQEANAYYSPSLRALVFGYFRASKRHFGRNLPGGAVFTCLSHDVVAHEATHSILHGLRPFFLEPMNPDVLAFHEAFADIVAILQRFSLPGFLEKAIQGSEAKLDQPDPLFKMGRQFGEAIGERGALRTALQANPDPRALDSIDEPHERGAILLAAVFGALVAVYRRRTQDLLRIATGGTGVLPDGALHHDLVTRLAGEARKTASHMLTICIRAVDYCPPLDITFGDYLRALITADHDLVPNDPKGYRVELVNAFRSWGIYPEDVVSLAESSLIWTRPRQELVVRNRQFRELRFDRSPHEAYRLSGRGAKTDYYRLLHDFIATDNDPSLCHFNKNLPVQVRSVQPVQRIGPDGRVCNEVVVQAIQTAKGSDGDGFPPRRGGSTLIINESGKVRYCIHKRVDSRRRTEARTRYLRELYSAPIGRALMDDKNKYDFRVIHRGW